MMADGGVRDVIAHSLRRERERAGLSLTALAQRAGIAKSTLSQLESGTGNPSVETLWALGMALGVPFSRLVDPPRPVVRVIRAGEGPAVAAERSDYVATLLAACPSGVRRDLYVIRAEPGQPHRSEPHAAGVIEHVIVCAGRAEVGPAPGAGHRDRDAGGGPYGEPVTLAPGDYAAYPADVAHVFRALLPGTFAVLVSEQP